MTIEDLYLKFYNEAGLLTFINEKDTGSQLIFNPHTKTFDESDPLTIQLRQRETEYGQQLDLSDVEVVKKKGKNN